MDKLLMYTFPSTLYTIHHKPHMSSAYHKVYNLLTSIPFLNTFHTPYSYTHELCIPIAVIALP